MDASVIIKFISHISKWYSLFSLWSFLPLASLGGHCN